MFLERYGKLISSLASWLLIVLFVVVFLNFRHVFSIQAGSAVVFVFLAVCLGALAINIRLTKWFLTSAYLSILIGLLNQFANNNDSNLVTHYSVAIALFGALLFWFLFYVQLWLPLVPIARVSPNEGKIMLSRVLLATYIPSLVSGAITIVVTFLIVFLKRDGIYVPWNWNPFFYAMLFVAVLSAGSAIVLIQKHRNHGPSSVGLGRALLMMCLILATLGTVEYIARQSWALLVLSGITFVGCFVSFWEMWLETTRIARTQTE